MEHEYGKSCTPLWKGTFCGTRKTNRHQKRRLSSTYFSAQSTVALRAKTIDTRLGLEERGTDKTRNSKSLIYVFRRRGAKGL